MPIFAFYFSMQKHTKIIEKDYLYGQVQNSLIKDLFAILKIFPERIVVWNAKDGNRNKFVFTNDDELSKIMKEGRQEAREDILRL